MGRLIDADKAISDYAYYGISHPYDACDLEDILAECSTAEAIPKDQYEARLKADMVAILTDIQLEIEELEKPRCHNASHADGCVSKWRVEGIIQQKINALKGEQEQ